MRDVSAASFGQPNQLKQQGAVGGERYFRSGVILSNANALFRFELPASDIVIEVDAKVAPIWTHVHYGKNYGGMPYLKTRDKARYSNWIRTDSVCIGSQLKVPAFLFFAPDNKPMAPLASGVIGQVTGGVTQIPPLPVSEHSKDFPPQGPILCEGTLVPADSFFREYADKQIRESLNEFENRTANSSIKALLEDVARKIINERFDQLAGLAATIAQERASTVKGSEKPPGGR